MLKQTKLAKPFIINKDIMSLYEKYYEDYDTYNKSKTQENWNNVRKTYDALEEKCMRLTEAIKATEGRANVRTLTIMNIISTLNDYSNYVGISKASMEGTCGDFCPDGQSFPMAYKQKGFPEATQFGAHFENGSWRIDWITRTNCPTWTRRVYLSDTAKDAILKKYE